MAEVISADGIAFVDPTVSTTLRASATGTSTSFVAETSVGGFGAMKQGVFVANVTAVNLYGGTAKLRAYIQRTPDGGVTWDDLLCIDTGNISAAGVFVGEYNAALGTLLTPAAVQDAGGSPAFAQRGSWLSELLRVKWELITGGSPTQSPSMTFDVTAKMRA